MNVLVFGGSGFLGNEIKNQCTSLGYHFFSASRGNSNDFLLDISSYEDFKKLPQDFFDVIINAATILPGGNYLDNDYLNQIYSANILGTQNICKWITTQKSIKKIINCSTLVVVSKPWNGSVSEEAKTYPVGDHVLYCGSKLFQELIVETFATKNNIDLVNLRFSAIYGKNMPKNGIIWNLYQQAIANLKIQIKNGNKVSFDFINVIDAAKTILASITNSNTGKILNVASGSEISLVELAHLIANKVNSSISIENEDIDTDVENFAKINISNLNKVIQTNDFVTLQEGINQLFEVW